MKCWFLSADSTIPLESEMLPIDKYGHSPSVHSSPPFQGLATNHNSLMSSPMLFFLPLTTPDTRTTAANQLAQIAYLQNWNSALRIYQQMTANSRPLYLPMDNQPNGSPAPLPVSLSGSSFTEEAASHYDRQLGSLTTETTSSPFALYQRHLVAKAQLVSSLPASPLLSSTTTSSASSSSPVSSAQLTRPSSTRQKNNPIRASKALTSSISAQAARTEVTFAAARKSSSFDFKNLVKSCLHEEGRDMASGTANGTAFPSALITSHLNALHSPNLK